MSKEFGTDPKKMLNWNKMLNKQSDYVKNAIEPLITVEFLNNKDFNENNNINEDYNKKQWEKLLKEDPISVKKYFLKSCEVVDLFNHLSNDGVFKGDEKPVVEKLKSLGIEGCRHEDRVDIYDDKYLENINLYHEKYFKYKWHDTEKIDGKLEDFIGEYLVFDLGKDNHNLDSYFVVGHFNEPPNPDKPDVLHTKIMFFQTEEGIEDRKPEFSFDSTLDFKTAKEIVENTAKHFNSIAMYSFDDMKEHIDLQIYKEQQLEKLEKHFEEYPETSKNKELDERKQDTSTEIAKKTGYVQGVCESVLAFNTDENRKIMSEAAMSILSKKILSEMNVTKDMARKFANPETYKALEQCVFTQNKEQHLEHALSL